MTTAMTQRLAAIRARRHAQGPGSASGTSVVQIDAPLILRDDTGAPHDTYSFNKAFRRVRDRVAADLPAAGDKRFQDFRDTAVTRLALAGCDLPQIAAITGHSLKSITTIIKHYLVMQPEMADQAIAKLQRWLEEQEIAL